jgi:hypothetical protein
MDIRLLDIYAERNSEFAHAINHKEGCKVYTTEPSLNTTTGEVEAPAETFACVVLSAEQFRAVQRLQQVQKLNGKTSGFDDLVEVLLTEGIKAKTRSEEYTYTSRARKQLDEGEAKLHTQMQQGKLTPHQYADALEDLRKRLRLGGSGIVL